MPISIVVSIQQGLRQHGAGQGGGQKSLHGEHGCGQRLHGSQHPKSK